MDRTEKGRGTKYEWDICPVSAILMEQFVACRLQQVLTHRHKHRQAGTCRSIHTHTHTNRGAGRWGQTDIHKHRAHTYTYMQGMMCMDG